MDVIACEDTRQTLKLLNHYQISKKLISHHSYNEEHSAQKIVSQLKAGLNVALVSDSGTPGVSDPGALVVRLVRQAGFTVVPIPGPCAVSTLVSVSGISARGMSFAGFLSPKKGRRQIQLKNLLQTGEGFVLYESPFRIVALLKELLELEPQRQLVIGREMTKIHEEFLFGRPEELLTILQKRPRIQGEFCVLVGPRKNTKEIDSE